VTKLKVFFNLTIAKVYHYAKTQKIFFALDEARSIPDWNVQKFEVFEDKNITWHSVIPKLFSVRLFNYSSSIEPFEFANRIVVKSISKEKLKIRDISGFHGGSVIPCPSADNIIEIGRKVSADFEQYSIRKLSKIDQLTVLTDEIDSFINRISWCAWHDKYTQTGGDGAHRTSSLIYLLNEFDLHKEVELEVTRYRIDLSELIIQKNQYSYYLFSPYLIDGRRTFSNMNEERLNEYGCTLRGEVTISNESLSLAVVDLSHPSSKHIETCFEKALSSNKVISLIDYLMPLVKKS